MENNNLKLRILIREILEPVFEGTSNEPEPGIKIENEEPEKEDPAKEAIIVIDELNTEGGPTDGIPG
jgi:hypothetical protein